MLTDDIKQKLNAKLPKDCISSRTKGGTNLSYIEVWRAIEHANDIFGYDGWSCETISCDKVSEEKNKNGNYVIGYVAKVRVTALGVTREGVGAGSGIAFSLFDAYEGAAKEAESDALKRALRSFGNMFGLCLYDKAQEGVQTAQEHGHEQAAKWAAGQITYLGTCSQAEIAEWAALDANAKALTKLRANYPDIFAEFTALGVTL